MRESIKMKNNDYNFKFRVSGLIIKNNKLRKRISCRRIKANTKKRTENYKVKMHKKYLKKM